MASINFFYLINIDNNNDRWEYELIMINNKKDYIGSYPSEKIASRVYDILSIKNRGIKARTNFIYNHIQLKKSLKVK